jgi:hypothetical protein
LNRRLGGVWNWSGCFVEEKKLLPLLGMRLWIITIPTVMSPVRIVTLSETVSFISKVGAVSY